MSMIKNIMIVGVGGQGSLLASRVLGRAAMEAGYDVKVSEVHGMSQRGGSVVTYVRYGKKVDSPVICEGEADVILSFEIMEAARWLPCLKAGGAVVASNQVIKPMPVITGAAVYPDELDVKMKALGVNLICADAPAIAKEAGSERASNVALIGMASHVLGFDTKVLRDAVAACVPAKALDINLKAYDMGIAAAAE